MVGHVFLVDLIDFILRIATDLVECLLIVLSYLSDIIPKLLCSILGGLHVLPKLLKLLRNALVVLPDDAVDFVLILELLLFLLGLQFLIVGCILEHLLRVGLPLEL